MVLEQRSVSEGVRDLIEYLKVQKMYVEGVIRDTEVGDIMKVFREVSEENGLRVKMSNHTEDDGQHLAVRGGGLTGTVVNLLPLGDLTRTGSREAIEMNVARLEDDLVVDISVVPLMILMDDEEAFVFTQGIFERFTDKKNVKETFDGILYSLKAKGIELKNDVPGEYRETLASSEFMYNPKKNHYYLMHQMKCPKCEYEYRSRTILGSKRDLKGLSTCTKCNGRFRVTLS